MEKFEALKNIHRPTITAIHPIIVDFIERISVPTNRYDTDTKRKISIADAFGAFTDDELLSAAIEEIEDKRNSRIYLHELILGVDRIRRRGKKNENSTDQRAGNNL